MTYTLGPSEIATTETMCLTKLIRVRRIPPEYFLYFFAGTKSTYSPYTNSYVEFDFKSGPQE